MSTSMTGGTLHRMDNEAIHPAGRVGHVHLRVAGAFLRALAGVAAISTGTCRPISIWQVNARA